MTDIDIVERLKQMDCDCNDGFVCANCEAIVEIKRLRGVIAKHTAYPKRVVAKQVKPEKIKVRLKKIALDDEGPHKDVGIAWPLRERPAKDSNTDEFLKGIMDRTKE